jgi:uncharacterized protein YkwD
MSAVDDRTLRVLERCLATTRDRARLPAVRRNAILDRAALRHARDMARRGYFAHESPEGSTVRDRVNAGGGRAFAACGENIAKGQADARAVHVAWMASRGHRDNILTSDWTDVGLAVAPSASGPVWVQVFATAPGSRSVRSRRAAR